MLGLGYSSTEVDYRKLFLVEPGHPLRLSQRDPAFKGHHESAESAANELRETLGRLSQLQTTLFAQHKHGVLIVLQGLDAAGKDGTVRHVFGAFNPMGASVAAFKTPTPVELEHDFLWRIHPHTPGKGQVAIFNRSHYEDVLVTRVHKQIDHHTWKERYAIIRHFEDELVSNGTTIVKFFLHISPEEQLARFQQRLDDPGRNWKISEADYAERQFWDAYMAAYEDALAETTQRHAPWYVIPSNHKWFRNLAVSQIVAETVDELHLAFPEPSVDLEDIRRRYHQAVEAEVRTG